MTVKIERRMGDARAGTVCYRAPDGSVTRTMDFYTDTPPGQMTDGDKAIRDCFAREMAEWFVSDMERAPVLETVFEKAMI